jgi:uncharacterized protein
MRTEQPIDADLVRQVSEDLALELVLLFGSYAGGALRPRPHSDVDVAVLLPQSPCADAYRTVYTGLALAVAPATLDLVILNAADPLLRLEVMSRSILVYGDPELFAEQKLLAYRIYVDSADLRALEGQLFRKRMHYLHEVLDGAA